MKIHIGLVYFNSDACHHTPWSSMETACTAVSLTTASSFPPRQRDILLGSAQVYADALEQDGEAGVLERRMHLTQHVCGRTVLEVQRRKQADLASSILEAWQDPGSDKEKKSRYWETQNGRTKRNLDPLLPTIFFIRIHDLKHRRIVWN